MSKGYGLFKRRKRAKAVKGLFRVSRRAARIEKRGKLRAKADAKRTGAF
jgi:hypothetical protein